MRNMDMPKTNLLVIGHRGAAGEAPENTLASFQLAVEQGCGAVELDVHLSKDGELIVCHDSTIYRTTSGTGRISGLTTAELKNADAGSWFGPAFAGERLPLLSEVFDLVPADVIVNVEIKDRNPLLLGRLSALLTAKNRRESTVISSFNHKVLSRLKQSDPDLRIGLLYMADLADHAGLADLFGGGVFSLHPHYSAIGSDDISRALGRGLRVYPYTVNEESDMLRLAESGVSGIITDYPQRLKRVLEGRD